MPWFPYPHKSVAELEAPKPTSTSWDFTYISPMLEDFMAAVYGNNHSTVINFSTQPCWLFGDANNKPQNCSFPANPDESFFGYVRGNRANLLDPTSSDLSKYYARLLSWLVKGEFTDENGVVHSGGPKYNLSRANGHVWELFNEAEHGYTWEQYVFDYDRVVPAMIDAVGGGANAPAFMGIGGASPSWVPPFLNKSNHGVSTVPPIDYFSLHHYSSCANRTDPSTYSTGFFGGADAFIQGTMISVLEQRAASSYPNVKIDLDELGVIMPDDNDPNFGIDAELPDICTCATRAAPQDFAHSSSAAQTGTRREPCMHTSFSSSPQWEWRCSATRNWPAARRYRSGASRCRSTRPCRCSTGARDTATRAIGR